MMAANMAPAAGAPSDKELADRLQLSLPALTHNTQAVEHVRGLMSIFAGAAAGVLGATGIAQVRWVYRGGTGWRRGARARQGKTRPTHGCCPLGGKCAALWVDLCGLVWVWR